MHKSALGACLFNRCIASGHRLRSPGRQLAENDQDANGGADFAKGVEDDVEEVIAHMIQIEVRVVQDVHEHKGGSRMM